MAECATGRRWSYAEFDTEVNRVVRGLLAVGARKGDRLGIWPPNRAEWTLVQYATAKIGVILVNINKIPRYVILTDDFPMTVTGKIRKVQMRSESIERLGLEQPPTTT